MPQSNNSQTGGGMIKAPGKEAVLYINPNLDLGVIIKLMNEGIEPADLPKDLVIHENLHLLYNKLGLSTLATGDVFPSDQEELGAEYSKISPADFREEAAIRNITDNLTKTNNAAPIVVNKASQIVFKNPEAIATPSIEGSTLSYPTSNVQTTNSVLSVPNSQTTQLSPYDYLGQNQQQVINNQLIRATSNPTENNLVSGINGGLTNANVQNQYLNSILNNYQKEIGNAPIFDYSSTNTNTLQNLLATPAAPFSNNNTALNSILNNINNYTPDQLSYLINTNPNLLSTLKANINTLENVVPTNRGLITSSEENLGDELNGNSSIANIISSLSRYGINPYTMPYGTLQNLYQNGYITPEQFNQYTQNYIAYPAVSQYSTYPQTYPIEYPSQYPYQNSYYNPYTTDYPNVYYPYYNGGTESTQKRLVEPTLAEYPYWFKPNINPSLITTSSGERYAPSLIASLFPQKNAEFIKNYNKKFKGIDIRPILKQTV